MKYKFIVIALIAGLLLAACGKQAENSDQVSANISTAVAQTLTAQYVPPTATQLLTETPTATATLDQQPTVMLASPTLPLPTTGTCYNAAYVSDVTIPDGTTLTAGSSFTKTWSVKNTGTCAWTKDFLIKFASGSQMGGTTTAIGSAVAVGSSINVSVKMTVPTTAGSYTGYWRMATNSGELFGGYVSVTIVSAAIPTGTMTGTATITRTPTVTPIIIVVTATPGPTNTTVPTTAVPTAVPTDTPVPTEIPTVGATS